MPAATLVTEGMDGVPAVDTAADEPAREGEYTDKEEDDNEDEEGSVAVNRGLGFTPSAASLAAAVPAAMEPGRVTESRSPLALPIPMGSVL